MSDDDAAARASVDALRRRVDAIPDALEEACDVPLPAAPLVVPRVITTGIGGSEGPARRLASALSTGGRVAARFVPLVAFYAGSLPDADLLVVFSQGLSPNASLALESRCARARWVVTSVGYDGAAHPRAAYLASLERDGVEAIRVPPGVEDGMLARIVGPEVASLLALRIAALLGAPSTFALPFAEAASAWPSDAPGVVLPERDVAIVTDAASSEWAFGLRWKLLETLLVPDPPVWDLLSVAHGPLQSFFSREVTLVVLETPASADLVERLAACVAPTRHRIVRVPTRRRDALGYFEHAAALDTMVLATLDARPRVLWDWPARGLDGALYGLEGASRGASRAG